MKQHILKWLKRFSDNPKTTILGLAKIFGSVWFMFANHAKLTPDHLMNPETFLPLGIFIAGITSLLSADAKDEIKAKDVTKNTTLVGEK